ncbi:hypothetical protein D3874_08340 [Oleomonas cavernae]|uniref:Uncharacterized protein n=1 Tax=Oleomonas cavernae TaxID=2320859 RepID=A0A418WAL8_9PROT|nr:hypothetical protein D3874_08340 [Oleomonas cavernae]
MILTSFWMMLKAICGRFFSISVKVSRGTSAMRHWVWATILAERGSPSMAESSPKNSPARTRA